MPCKMLNACGIEISPKKLIAKTTSEMGENIHVKKKIENLPSLIGGFITMWFTMFHLLR